MSKRPDFGMIVDNSDGIELSCRAVVPGLSLHDLVMLFDAAHDGAKPGADLSGNPSEWPVVRGVNAVAEAMLDALYPPE